MTPEQMDEFHALYVEDALGRIREREAAIAANEAIVRNNAIAKAAVPKLSERERWRYTFAGMAMQGMLADPKWKPEPDDACVVPMAVAYADDLLKELERKPEEKEKENAERTK